MLLRLPVAQRKSLNTLRTPPHEVLDIEGGASRRGNSYWKRLRGCPREHGLADVAKIRRVGDQEALTVGLTHHHALEAYYCGLHAWQHALGTTAERPDIVNDEYLFGGISAAEKAAWNAVAPMRDAEGYSATYAEVERMLASYFDQYRRRDRWRVIAVEETLEYEDDGMAYSARLDLIVEDYERRGMWIVEHKSARAITEDLLHGYQLDQQILGQAWLLHKVVDLTQYPPFRGVLVNIVTKHKEPRFERVEVCPSRRHLAAFEQSMREWHEVAKLFERLRWPKALGNCAGPAHYFKRCEFFDLCHGRPEASVEDFARMSEDALPFGYVKRTDPLTDDEEM